MKQFLLITMLVLTHVAMGQAGLFQDAKGESALKLFGNSASLSTKDESINFAAGKYTRSKSRSASFERFGRWASTLELRANEGIASFKDEKKVLLDGSVGLYRGWKKVSAAKGTEPAFALERFFAASIGADRNKLFNTAMPAKDMVYSEGQFVYKLELGQFGYTGDFLYGFSSSYKQQTNVNDIKAKSVSFLDYASANDSTLVFRQKQAFDVTEFIGRHHVFSINADGVWLLNRAKATGSGTIPPVFLALHLRHQFLEGETGQFNPALGFYLGKHGAPRDIVGGFNVQFLDLFNGKTDHSNAWDRAAISFVVGFRLSN